MKNFLILLIFTLFAGVAGAQTLDLSKTLADERKAHQPEYTYWNFNVSGADTVYAGSGDSVYYVGVNVNKHTAVNGGWFIEVETLAGDKDSLKVDWQAIRYQFHSVEDVVANSWTVPRDTVNSGTWTQNNDDWFTVGDSITALGWIVPDEDYSNYRSEILKLSVTQIGAADTFLIKTLRYKAFVNPSAITQ
jgi:hypothetical protein